MDYKDKFIEYLRNERRYSEYTVNGYDDKNPDKSYYEVRVFFKFDLPLVGNIYTFAIDGETVDIDFPADEFPAVSE